MQDSTYRKNPDIVFRDIAGELILVPIHRRAGEADSIYVLNETGARIWELTDGRTSLSRIAESICSEFDICRETVLDDLLSYVGQMVEAGILEEVKWNAPD